MPWRLDTRAYYIVVSELMLQQTQVDRVIPKFVAFINEFPDFSSLASASLKHVLTTWQGLGYNRRAIYLHKLAQTVVAKYACTLPSTLTELETLPGIGHATASAICAYAHNQPVVYIETNIRSIYLHHFFTGQTDVPDSALLPLIEQTLDHKNPREWYWALMDYGVWIKKTYGNPNARSKHHYKQSSFAGSTRQKRGAIIAYLTIHTSATRATLAQHSKATPDDLTIILDTLQKDGLITQHNGRYSLPN